jgi:hypothetical protein
MIFRGSYRLGEGEAWGAQQEEEFAGPEQNVQQTAALQIAQVLRLEADVEGFSRAFLDEGAHGGQVDGFNAEFAAAGINALESFIAAQKEMVQAESLAIQCSNRGPATSTHLAVSFPSHRIQSPPPHWSNPTTGLIPF